MVRTGAAETSLQNWDELPEHLNESKAYKTVSKWSEFEQTSANGVWQIIVRHFSIQLKFICAFHSPSRLKAASQKTLVSMLQFGCTLRCFMVTIRFHFMDDSVSGVSQKKANEFQLINWLNCDSLRLFGNFGAVFVRRTEVFDVFVCRHCNYCNNGQEMEEIIDGSNKET